MQVEVPPWVSQWLSAAEWRRRQRERDRRVPGLTLYAYGPYARRDPPDPVLPVQPIFRIGSFSEQRDGVLGPRYGAGPAPGPGAGVHTAGGWVPLHYPLDPFLAHNTHDRAHIPINMQGTRPQRVNVEWFPPGTADGPRAPAPGGGGAAGEGAGGMLSGRAALRAWVFGSALIVLVLVLVRAIDKCLTVNILKSRRRSREWPTPNVRATNRLETDISTVMIPEPRDDEPRPADYSDVLSVDLPPPYSECTTMASGAGSGGDAHITPGPSGHKLPGYEDPPPAYSDTYVEFSNKNGVPSVLIYSRRRTPLVNRRDIVGSEVAVNDDGSTDSELNAQNTNIETNNEARDVRRDIDDEARYIESNENNTSHIEPLNASDTTSQHKDANVQNNATNTNVDRVASSNQTAVEPGKEEHRTKDGEIMV